MNAPEPLPSAADATATLSAGRDPTPAGPSSAPDVPGYELLGELGRGGMGVVYKARHLGLDRLVALKVILHADHAAGAERARFRSEAEAVARLSHPHIVAVHEVGVYHGRPFLALEFCPGGSLDKKLAGTPLPARDAAALVERLARAMEAAHQVHVVHRDLSPANVLLAADGTPKVSDFGLAKRLDRQGATVSGAVVGTPSYIAPEQALGHSKQVGPAADVYGLGAVLYECLTGRPPFRAATIVDTLAQVVRAEPVPPSQLQPGCPRDLETICLKCLRKEPAKRYGSAGELADDLGRFLRGEPVAARPVGRVGRGWRWCMRNPALAAALAAVLLVFFAGAAASSTLAVLAARRADDATREEGKARVAADKARDRADDAAKKAAAARAVRAALEEKSDQLRASAARSLGRLLGMHLQPGEVSAPLSDEEVEVLRELATSADARLRDRFIEEALRGPLPTRQLKDRAAYALQAALGLDTARRDRMERLLGTYLDKPGISPAQRRDVALVLVQLKVQDAALVHKAVRALGEAMTADTPPLILSEVAQNLAGMTRRLEFGQAALVCRRAADVLIQVMSRSPDTRALESLSKGLAALAPGLGPKEATEVGAALSRVLLEITDPYALQHLAEGLSLVARRMEPGEAAALFGRVMTIRSPQALGQLVRGVLALAPRLTRKEAVAVCRPTAAALNQALMNTTEAGVWQQLAEELAAVSVYLEAKEAAAVCGRGVLTLIPNLGKSGALGVGASGSGLSALAARMGPKEAGEATLAVSRAMTPAADFRNLRALATMLPPLAARTEPAAAKEAAALLTTAMSQVKHVLALGPLAEALAAVAARLERDEAAAVRRRGAAILIRALDKLTPGGEWIMAQGLSALAAHMGPGEAGETLFSFCQALVRKDAPRLVGLHSLLQGLAARADPRKVKEAATLLHQAMKNTSDLAASGRLAQGVAALARRLGPAEETALCRATAATLLTTVNKTPDADVPEPVLRGLGVLTAHLGPEQAAEGVSLLLRAMNRMNNPWMIANEGNRLSALAGRMEPGRAVAVFHQALKRTKNPLVCGHLARGLSAAARLGRGKAAGVWGEAAALLLEALARAKDPQARRELTEGLAALALRMEPGKVADTLARAMSQTKNPEVLGHLAPVLAAAAGRLDAKEAAALCRPAAAALLRALTRKSDSNPEQFLARALSALAARMEPGEAAATLRQALTRATNPYAQRDLVVGLSEVVTRLGPGAVVATLSAALNQRVWETPAPLVQRLAATAARVGPKDAAVVCRRAAAALIQALSKAPRDDPDPRQQLTRALAAVLRREALWQSDSPRCGLAGAVGASADPGSVLLAAALLRPAVDRPPPPLPAGALVELLKGPLCVGEARRLVLGELSRHYGRPFAGPWDFARFAQERRLPLDLLSPPQ